MRLRGLVHHHPLHRARQLRWVLPIMMLVLLATVGTLIVQYQVSNQAVGTEFFRAHKTIGYTGELLRRGTVIGSLVLIVLVLAIALWAFRLTHRIVAPVHTLHRALDALVEGDLGVRVELQRADEFREVGDALNRLVDEFATTLTKVHALVDRAAGLMAASTHPPNEPPTAQFQALVTEIEQTMEFFHLEPRRTIREERD